jgi:chemotaxis protein MotB
MSGKEKSHRRRASHGAGGHGGGHHGGAWKVAYADFTTAMMAFFMLMWILAASSPKQKQAIAQYFRSEGPFKNGGAASLAGNFSGGPGFMQMPVHNSIVEETQALEMAARELSESMEDGGAKGEDEGTGQADSTAQGEGTGQGKDQGAGDKPGLSDMKDQVTISVTDDGLVIEITDDTQEELFAVGSAKMNPAFERTLDAVAKRLKGLPNAVRVEGYTDARPYPPGVDYSNWELSSDRANAARRRLEEHGVPRERFESVTGYGDTRPAAPASPLAPANRRITITVLRQHPVKPAPAPTPSEGPITGFSPFGEPVPQERPETYDAADESTGEHAAPATLGNDHVER